ARYSIRVASAGYVFKVRLEAQQNGGSVRRCSNIGDEIKTVAKAGRGIETSDWNRELLVMAWRADEQDLAVENLDIRLQIGRKKCDQIVRRFPVQRGAAEDGQHIDRHPILQNGKTDVAVRSD